MKGPDRIARRLAGLRHVRTLSENHGVAMKPLWTRYGNQLTKQAVHNHTCTGMSGFLQSL
jgi:hypothetical protein